MHSDINERGLKYNRVPEFAAISMPYLTCIVGNPLRNNDPSSMSSIISDALCIISHKAAVKLIGSCFLPVLIGRPMDSATINISAGRHILPGLVRRSSVGTVKPLCSASSSMQLLFGCNLK